jgi:hypothetical protein
MNYKQLLLKIVLCVIVLSNNATAQALNTLQSNSIIACSTNLFWGLALNNNTMLYDVYELELNNNTINNNGKIATDCPGIALGFGNNSVGFSPTLFSNYDTIPIYYDSTIWQSTGITDSLYLFHCGSYGSNIYYSGTINVLSKYILNFNGNILKLIYQMPLNTSLAVADIAVDASNNVWFFTKEDSLPFYATVLNVIDSSGNLLSQYNTYFDITSAYGLCIIGDSLFIGFGIFNTNFPNTLVSVSLNGNSASLNNVIQMPVLSFSSINYDLASCNPGVPTGFKNIRKPPAEQINVYPNPAVDKITIDHIPKNAQELSIINSMGAIIFLQKLNGENKLDLFTASYAPGMYAVCIKTNADVLVRKWIKGKD